MRVMKRSSHAERGTLLTIVFKCCLEKTQSYNTQSTMTATPMNGNLQALL